MGGRKAEAMSLLPLQNPLHFQASTYHTLTHTNSLLNTLTAENLELKSSKRTGVQLRQAPLS